MMDFLRPESTDGRLAGLTPAQWVAMGFGVLCAVLLFQRVRSKESPVWAPSEAEKASAA
jgi:hypothetical protein